MGLTVTWVLHPFPMKVARLGHWEVSWSAPQSWLFKSGGLQRPWCIIVGLRRASAILLLVVFSFPLISPMLFARSESTLPACCRRDGKHHCSMESKADSPQPSGASALEGAPSRCPLFPKGSTMPSAGKTSVPRPAWLLQAPVRSYPAATEQTEARYRISFSRVWQKRGPPSLFS